MKLFAKAAAVLTAKLDFADLLLLAGMGLVCYGCSLIHPAGLPISSGLALIYLAVTA